MLPILRSRKFIAWFPENGRSVINYLLVYTFFSSKIFPTFSKLSKLIWSLTRRRLSTERSVTFIFELYASILSLDLNRPIKEFFQLFSFGRDLKLSIKIRKRGDLLNRVSQLRSIGIGESTEWRNTPVHILVFFFFVLPLLLLLRLL